jgi:diguanylate cyclase (GGDEF)-like protein/PAS domain S-box-containing protein
VAQGTPYDLDCRIVRASGEVAWLNAKGAARRSESGEVVELNGTAQDITERKELALALAEANAELDDLYDHAPCGYYSLDANGHYTRINSTMLAWIGYRREEAIGRLGPRDSFSPASQAQFDSHFPLFLKTGRLHEVEFELMHRAGQLRAVSVSATAVVDEQGRFLQSRSVMFDVTELRRAQAQVLEVKHAQDAILQSQLVGVVKLRQRLAIWVNPALCKIFGYTEQELQGQSARMLYADDASFEALGKAAYPLLASGNFYRTQLQMRRKDGSLIWIDLQGVLMDSASGESLWMMSDISSMRQQQEQFEFHATHDALTGLANRALLNELVPQALAQAKRQGVRAAICYLDLDRFKPINDRHGHAVGDQVLQAVAERLQACVRAADVVARVGGDEFVLLLTGLEDAARHRPICERARAAIAAPITTGTLSVSVGVSIGVALFPDDGGNMEELTSAADKRMYEDKSQGGRLNA